VLFFGGGGGGTLDNQLQVENWDRRKRKTDSHRLRLDKEGVGELVLRYLFERRRNF